MYKRFPTFLCPICMVKFPYHEKLTQHWSLFHAHQKRGSRQRLRSNPSVSHAAATAASPKHHGGNSARKCDQALLVYYLGKAKNRKHSSFTNQHVYKTVTINEHIPEICQHCNNIIWNCAKSCINCQYICHVQCEQFVINSCKKMLRETKSVGEYTRDYATIGELRGYESVSSPSPTLSPCMSPRTLSPCCESNDLDVTYITDRLVAMSFPATGMDSLYHTSLLKVIKMLQSRHTDKYKIINLSERRYDILKLHQSGQVLDYGWPDHLAPPLERLDKIINTLHSWLENNLKNVAVLHCKGGRSRIGVVIATYIQFSKNSPSPQSALDWFALRRYYDAKLEGSTHPSQKRYVQYFGKIYEKQLKISNKRVFFQNIIMHGIPEYGNGSTIEFCLKIYQGYHLKHTTKTYCVSRTSKRAFIAIEDGVLLHGDVMIKCLQKGTSQRNVIFRLQFHTDALEECVAVFGKYDLDEAFREPSFPDSCYMEFIFAPSTESQRRQEQAQLVDHRSVEKRKPSRPSITNELDLLISQMSYPPKHHSKTQNGIFDMERRMAGVVEADRLNANNPTHVPGPIDGNPYAQIDPSLKDKLRNRHMVSEMSYDAAKGIEELDDLLGEINVLSNKNKPDINGNNVESHKKLQPRLSVTKMAPRVIEEKVNIEHRGVLHQAPTLHFAPPSDYVQPISPPVDNVFHRQDSSSTAASSINDLLFELDNSPLNTTLPRRPSHMKRNMSAYDNDSFNESDADTSDGKMERHESVEGLMEISPGTVAQHVRNLNKILFKDEDTADYNRKYGVPLAGLNSPDIVEEKVTQFNSRSVAPGFCSSPVPNVYHSQGAMTSINYEVKPNHESERQDHGKSNGHVWFDSDSTDLPSDDMSSIPSSHHSQHDINKGGSVLSRTDSAYGESMRSSTSSPMQATQHDDEAFTHIGGDITDGVSVNVDVTHKDGEHMMTDSYSPRSDGNNGKSSGIGSITSSMTSLDDEILHQHHVNNQAFQIDQKHHQKLQQHAAKQQEEAQQQQKASEEEIRVHQQITVESAPSYELKSNKHAPPTLLKTVHHHQPPEERVVILEEVPVQEIPAKKPVKPSLTVVDEHIPSAVIQKEVEFLNDDIFKSLLEEDLKLSTNENHTLTTTKMPISTPKFNSDRLTTSSTEDEVNITDLILEERKQPQAAIKHTSFNSNTIFNSTAQEESPLPPSRQPEPSPHSIPKFNHQNSQQLSPTSNGVALQSERPSFQRQTSHGSTNSDTSSPRSPGGSRYPTLVRGRRRGGSGSSNSSVSSAELFHEVTRYPSIKFEKDTMALWYKPKISRDEATKFLRDREAGAFVVRDSQSYEGAFGLAVKVETPPLGVLQQVGGDLSKVDLDNELVRHFLIEPCKKGVRLKGSNNEPTFPSLVALVYQHTLTKMALPVTLVIPELDSVDGATKLELTEADLLEKGAACNLAFLGAVLVESLTGDGAVHYAMNKVTSQNANMKSTIVNIKVNQQGITLTDNQRRVFFRKHYPMKNVIHCGVDPKGRKINLKPIIESLDKEVGCFGFVVKKEENSQQHICLILAEMDIEQPASAVINFIHKAMRYSKV